MYSIPSSTDTTPENYADLLKVRLSDAYQRVNRHVESQQRNQKKYYDRGQRGKPYTVGDIVLLHEPAVQRGNSRKFHRPWKGPFKIVKVISSSVYRIQHCKHGRRRKVVYFNRLKPAKDLVLPPNQDQATGVPNADAGAPILHNGPEEVLEDEYEFYTLPYEEETSSQPQLRRSTRISRPPQRYGDVLTYPDSYSSSDDDS